MSYRLSEANGDICKQMFRLPTVARHDSIAQSFGDQDGFLANLRRSMADAEEQTAIFMAFVLHFDIICISLHKRTRL